MQAHLLISGYVQKVGYRQFVKKIALKLGLSGWVCNLENGKVEALVQGSKERIEEAIKDFKKGPFLSEVKDVQIEWKKEDFTEIVDFKIIH